MDGLIDFVIRLHRTSLPLYALVTVGAIWTAAAAAGSLATRLLDLLAPAPGAGRRERA